MHNGSNVYGIVLDATKAFDRIDFEKTQLVIRLIMEMCDKQCMAVRGNN